MGKLDIIQWTGKSTATGNDLLPVNACFGLYPRLFTENKFIYKAVMVSDDLEKPEICVVKARRFRPGTDRFWQGEIDLNRYATEMVVAFTDQTLAAKIDFVNQYLAPLHGYTKWDKMRLKMKPRYFRRLLKFEIVLIEDAVRNLKVLNNDKVLEAFSHFTYSESNGTNMLHSFRGSRTNDGKYFLLTPEMFTHKFDIHRWFQKHTCNNICGKFKIPIENSLPDKPDGLESDTMFYNFDSKNLSPNLDQRQNNLREAPKDNENKQGNFETTFGGKSCDGTYSVVTALVHTENDNKFQIEPVSENANIFLDLQPDLESENINKNKKPEEPTSNLIANGNFLDNDEIDSGQLIPMDNVKEYKQVSDICYLDIEQKCLENALLAKNKSPVHYDHVNAIENEVNESIEAPTLVIRQKPCYSTEPEKDNLLLLNQNSIYVENEYLLQTLESRPNVQLAMQPENVSMELISDETEPLVREPNPTENIDERFDLRKCTDREEDIDERLNPEMGLKGEEVHIEATSDQCDETSALELSFVGSTCVNKVPKLNTKQDTFADDMNNKKNITSDENNANVVNNHFVPDYLEQKTSPILQEGTVEDTNDMLYISEPESFAGIQLTEPTTEPICHEKILEEIASLLPDNYMENISQNNDNSPTSENMPAKDEKDLNKSVNDNFQTTKFEEDTDNSIVQEDLETDPFHTDPFVHDYINIKEIEQSKKDPKVEEVISQNDGHCKTEGKEKIEETLSNDFETKEKPPNPDFLIKYNLHVFVDKNEVDICENQIQVDFDKDYVPIEKQCERKEEKLVQKPLQSSLRSGKKRNTGRSVKFADDVNDLTRGNFIVKQESQNLNTSINVPPVVLIKNQNNAPSLEPLTSSVDMKDPNWYTYIPCECCDENITGRD